MISNKDYKAYLETEENGYIELWKFTLGLPKNQSVMLSYLIDANSKPWSIRWEEDDNYIQINQKGYIDQTLSGWSWKEINSALNDLEEAGYLKKIVKNVNMRNCTFVSLNIDKIEALRHTKCKHANLQNVSLYTDKMEVCEHTKSEHANLQNVSLYTDKREACEPTKSEHANLQNSSSQSNKSEVNEKVINEKVINEKVSNEKVKNEVIPADAASLLKDESFLNSKGYKNIIRYINDYLMFNDNTIKDELKNWYECNKGLVSVKQLQAKLKAISEETNNNESLIKEAIHNAYINNWKAFYNPSNSKKSFNSKPVTTTNKETTIDGYKIGDKVDLSKNMLSSIIKNGLNSL